MNRALYSPRQIFWGTFVGGPFALVYLLNRNFKGLEKHNEARQTIILGVPAAIAVLFLLVVTDMMLNIKVNLSIPLFIACAASGQRLARDQQFKNQGALPEGYRFRPTWLVCLNAFGCLVAWAVVAVLAFLGLDLAGIPIDT